MTLTTILSASVLAASMVFVASPALAQESRVNPEMTPQLARGKAIFETEAGGIGCDTCHGPDAAGLVGPDIRGKDSVDIVAALASVPQMSFIRLNRDDLLAVQEYLRYLHDTVAH